MRPTRPSAALLLAACALAPLVGCRDPEREREAPPPDPAVVRALVELHLADARAETTGAPRDSLRRVALEAAGTDSVALARALDRASRDPLAAEAVWGAVTSQLEAERAGASAPEDTSGNP